MILDIEIFPTIDKFESTAHVNPIFARAGGRLKCRTPIIFLSNKSSMIFRTRAFRSLILYLIATHSSKKFQNFISGCGLPHQRFSHGVTRKAKVIHWFF